MFDSLYNRGIISDKRISDFSIPTIYSLEEFTTNNLSSTSKDYTLIHGDVHQKGRSARIEIKLRNAGKVSTFMILPDVDYSYALIKDTNNNEDVEIIDPIHTSSEVCMYGTPCVLVMSGCTCWERGVYCCYDDSGDYCYWESLIGCCGGDYCTSPKPCCEVCSQC